jgi:hypothetical protein
MGRGDGPALLDQFIPNPEFGGRNVTVVAAPADLVFDVASEMDLRSIPAVRAIFWLRETLFRSTPAPRQPQGLVTETLALGWGRLAERPKRELVMGAVTQPWRADVVFRAVAPEEFAAFAEPDLVKIAWTLEADPIDAVRTRFATETRVVCTSSWARRRFRRYWRLVGIGILLIRWLVLSAVRRDAEGRFRVTS